MARQSRLALEFRANQLEMNTGSAVTGGVVNRRGVRFHLKPRFDGRLPDAGQLARLFGGRVRVRAFTDRVEVETEPARQIPLGQLIAGRQLPPLTAVLGVAGHGQAAMLKLNETTRHLVIHGADEQSKTALLRIAVLSLMMSSRQRHFQLATIGNLREIWRDWPHLLKIAPAEIGRFEAGPNRPRLIVAGSLADIRAGGLDLPRLLQQPGIHLMVTAPAPEPGFSVSIATGSEPDICRITVGEARYEVQPAMMLPAETDAVRLGLEARHSRVWTLDEIRPVRASRIRQLLKGRLS